MSAELTVVSPALLAKVPRALVTRVEVPGVLGAWV